MNTSKNNFKRFAPNALTTFLFLVLLSLYACKSEKKEAPITPEPVAKEITIITEDMEFQMPDTIPSGWNTFIYKNQSAQTHFFLVDKYPVGKTSADAKKEVMPVFDRGMGLINEGKAEEGFAAFGALPTWFSEVVFVGGSGLISPNHTGQSTFYLQPGPYMVECYVKMSNGMFHSSMGMVKDIYVSDTNSGNEVPTETIKIDLSSTNGIVVKDNISTGTHTFAVHYLDQIVHENFVGHDVSLAKLDDNADLTHLENWMNWADPKGLIEPAPKGVTFLGGINDMPAGSIGYFTATVSAGRYVLISEVPNTKSKNMLQIIEVSD